MNKAALRKSERIYGFLLRFYPKNYRQEFGEEMKYVFSASLKDAYTENGEQAVINFWVRTIIDASKSLVTQHLENKKGGESMKTKHTNSITQNNIFRIALGTAGILLIPLVAMQFSSEWDWKLLDFIVIGVLLFGTGLAYELIVKRVGKKHKIVIAAMLLVVLLLIWAELAVGIFGTPFAGS